MATIRTRDELAALRAEAEQRVRGGHSRADVAQALGIQPSTLSNWALVGRWRLKDLAGERADEQAHEFAKMVAELRTRQSDAARREAEQAARTREIIRAIKAGQPPGSGAPWTIGGGGGGGSEY